MKRTKPPALTSPWKIGFFVSLMMVSVSSGVAYFFIDKFGVKWNWLDKNEWMSVIKGEGFLFELLPAIALVAVTAMFSYLVIAGAVRKYKRYLDSGIDYKNLLISLKDIHDLEDKSKIEKIRNHPELKRLLLGVSEHLTEQREALANRETELAVMTDAAVAEKQNDLVGEFSTQCEALAAAIRNGADDLISPETGVSNPSLRTLGEAIQSRFESIQRSHNADAAAEDFGRESALIKNKFEAITIELRGSSDGAREIEKLLNSLSGDDSPETDQGRLDAARGEIRGALGTLKSLEELSALLESLSEEAKGIAIGTALHAGSGEGTQDDLIRLAEEVKEMATSFKGGTDRFSVVASEMRSSMGSLESLIGSEMQSATPQTDTSHSLASLSKKVSLWVERVMVLNEKVSNLKSSLEEPVAPAQASVPVSDVDESFEMKDIPEGDLPEGDIPEGDLPEGDLPEGDLNDGFEKTQSAPRFPDPTSEFGFEMLDRSKSLFGQPVDGRETSEPETQRDKGIFEELPADAADSREIAEDADITDEAIGSDETNVTGGVDSSDESDVTAENDSAPETPSEPEIKGSDLPGFESFARPTPRRFDTVAPDEDASVEPSRFPVDEDRFGSHEGRLQPFENVLKSEKDSNSLDNEAAETTTEKSQTEKQNDVVDLYELGAVDYDPAVHG